MSWMNPWSDAGSWDPLRDIDREFRRIDRQMRRLERDVFGGQQQQLGGFGGGQQSLGWSGDQGQNQLALPFGGGNQVANVGSLLDNRFPLLPNIVDQGGQKLMQFQVDTTGFKPEDITIKTQDDKIVITGKHEEKSNDFHRYREFHRMVAIPQGVKAEELKSRLTPQGLLTIEAPVDINLLQQNVQGRELPIQHMGKQQQQAIGQSGGQSVGQSFGQSGRQNVSQGKVGQQDIDIEGRRNVAA